MTSDDKRVYQLINSGNSGCTQEQPCDCELNDADNEAPWTCPAAAAKAKADAAKVDAVTAV